MKSNSQSQPKGKNPGIGNESFGTGQKYSQPEGQYGNRRNMGNKYMQ